MHSEMPSLPLKSSAKIVCQLSKDDLCRHWWNSHELLESVFLEWDDGNLSCRSYNRSFRASRNIWTSNGEQHCRRGCQCCRRCGSCWRYCHLYSTVWIHQIRSYARQAWHDDHGEKNERSVPNEFCEHRQDVATDTKGGHYTDCQCYIQHFKSREYGKHCCSC